ncbi:ATP-binding protein [Streptomyces sp. NPDC059740]|uniref:ATP-binding protein n=1 Tax=Streptomyces sp. NPDC059740 TaxID=3346926 RepID=UPI003652AB6E
MKQGTIRTLGAAALGAALAAVAAGSASAAPTDGLLNAAHTLPANAPTVLDAGAQAVTQGTQSLADHGAKATQGRHAKGKAATKHAKAKNAGLLGGLPTDGVTHAVSGAGLPLGG